MFITCPLYRAVVHHSVWLTFWVASTVAYLDAGFHLENKGKSMFWHVICEEFKRRNVSCCDGIFVCFKQERGK